MATNRLTWTAATAGDAPIAGYRLYNADNDALIVDIANPAVLTYDHTDQLVGTYRYYVVAYATDGQSGAHSNVVTLSVEETDPVFDDVVVLLTANTGALVEWSGLPTTAVVGGGALSTEQVKFGTHSFRNPGTGAESTNYVRLEDATDGQGLFVFPGELTIEGWFYIVSQAADEYNNFFANSINYPTSGFIQLAIRTSADDLFWNSSAGAEAITNVTCPVGQWVFVAVTRDASNVFRIWQDGVMVYSGTKAGTMGALNPVRSSLDTCRGHAGDNADLNCYFDQIRMTKRCRYTANFTPPSEPFPTS